jgi:hypothetical protein
LLCSEEDDAVSYYAITATDPRLKLRTKNLAGTFFDVKLGKDTFAKLPDDATVPDTDPWIPGQKEQSYFEPIPGGGSGAWRYQYAYLGWDGMGCGGVATFTVPASSGDVFHDQFVDRTRTTINTIVIGGPFKEIKGPFTLGQQMSGQVPQCPRPGRRIKPGP